jgi:hypothetical protein
MNVVANLAIFDFGFAFSRAVVLAFTGAFRGPDLLDLAIRGFDRFDPGRRGLR